MLAGKDRIKSIRKVRKLKLHLSVLADEFPERDCELTCGGLADSEWITGIWMLPAVPVECRPERLYVCTAEEYERESSRPGLQNLAVVGGTSRKAGVCSWQKYTPLCRTV